jgi:RNA polymerase sigma-70 factor (ECF subfamily)
MTTLECGTTDSGLIRRVADWRDASAWWAFDATYRPIVRAWGRGMGLTGEEADELCQVVMIGVARRMGDFRYDPSRTFRGWLLALTRSRAVDLARVRGRDRDRFDRRVDDRDEAEPARLDPVPPAGEDQSDGIDPILRRLADQVQQAVRDRVSPESWRIFWMVRIEGTPVAEVAQAVGKTYAAAYRNQHRVAAMLRAEADRLVRIGGVDG